MIMKTEVTIDSIDVTDYVLSWEVEENWGDAEVGEAILTLSKTVNDIITITANTIVTIKRGWDTADTETFEGYITQIKPEVGSIIKLVCKDPLFRAINNRRVKSWDKDIDSQAGVGSEIFKDICDHSGIEYDATTVPTTGTSGNYLIQKFVQNDEDDFQKMKELAQLFDRIIQWRPDTRKVHFIKRGLSIYPITLNVGTEITKQIKWKENCEQMINKVKIQGATVYDKITETFVGPASEFTLSKNPEETEVRTAYTGANILKSRGQKDLGTIGTDFDYYVDVEQKKVVFSGDVSDVWIQYGAQVPMPIVLSNMTSINTNGLYYKKFNFHDIKDIADAENRGRMILNRLSQPLYQAHDIFIDNTIIQTHGDIKPGDKISITDSYNDLDLTLVVNSVKKKYPHVNDIISVGAEDWRMEDWQISQMEKLNQLFNELNKNEGVLISTIEMTHQIEISRRVFTIYKTKICDSFILGHPVNGLLGMGEVLDNLDASAADWTISTGTRTNESSIYIQGTGSLKITTPGGSSCSLSLSYSPAKDFSLYSGVASGAATQGTVGLWLYADEDHYSKINSVIIDFIDTSGYNAVTFRSYSAVDGYDNWPPTILALQIGWNYLVGFLPTGFRIGFSDWTAVTAIRLRVGYSTNSFPIYYLDYLTVSKSNYIGLNGLGRRPMQVKHNYFPLSFPIIFYR